MLSLPRLLNLSTCDMLVASGLVAPAARMWTVVGLRAKKKTNINHNSNSNKNNTMILVIIIIVIMIIIGTIMLIMIRLLHNSNMNATNHTV